MVHFMVMFYTYGVCAIQTVSLPWPNYRLFHLFVLSWVSDRLDQVSHLQCVKPSHGWVKIMVYTYEVDQVHSITIGLGFNLLGTIFFFC